MPDTVNNNDNNNAKNINNENNINNNSTKFQSLINNPNFFVRLSKAIVQDLVNNKKESLILSKYTKEQVVDYLANPQRYETKITEISTYLYFNSPHYRRVCNYFSRLITLNYSIVSYNLLDDKIDYNKYLSSYMQAINYVNKLNFKVLLPRIMNMSYFQDLFCGLYYETPNSFDIVNLDPSYCQISSKKDGCYVFSLDFSYFNTREYLLDSYGATIRNMYNKYKGYTDKDGKKHKGDNTKRWQEPPNQICLKANEDQLQFSYPPFAAIFPDILNLEEYKALRKSGELIDKYKLLVEKIPLDEDGNFKIDEDMALDFYNQSVNNIASNIGVILSPMEIDPIDFNTSSTKENTSVVEAEGLIFKSTGSNGALFGSAEKATSSILDMSTKNDETFAMALVLQAQNWINLKLKLLKLPYDFKIEFLEQSIFNRDNVTKTYKEAATYGVDGARSKYSASIDLSPSDSFNYHILENVLNFVNKWIPMKSSNTMSSDTNSDNGRPTNESNGELLKESGEQTKDNESNSNR